MLRKFLFVFPRVYCFRGLWRMTLDGYCPTYNLRVSRNIFSENVFPFFSPTYRKTSFLEFVRQLFGWRCKHCFVTLHKDVERKVACKLLKKIPTLCPNNFNACVMKTAIYVPRRLTQPISTFRQMRKSHSECFFFLKKKVFWSRSVVWAKTVSFEQLQIFWTSMKILIENVSFFPVASSFIALQTGVN